MSVPPFDPLTAPIVGNASSPPASPLPPDRLGCVALRQRFLHPPSCWGMEPLSRLAAPIPSEAERQALVRAAVLVALLPGPDGLGVLLTVRSGQLRNHRGQIAFPGGRIDSTDVSPEAAALREAQEEIGLPGAAVDVLGTLPWHETGTGYRVRPVIGLLQASVRPEWLPLERAEVDELFVVPLSFLMNPAHHQLRQASWWRGSQQLSAHFYAMPWRNPAGREYFIWGATAAMLRNLYHFLAAD